MSTKYQKSILANYGFHPEYVDSLSSLHAHRLIHQLSRIARRYYQDNIDLQSKDLREALAKHSDLKVVDLVHQLAEVSR